MNGLVVKQTNGRGLGVFATRRIEKGELIECCRVIIVPRTEVSIAGTTSVLRHYVVEWGDKLAIPTGYGPFYNHSYQPNAIHSKHLDLGQIHFLALCDILPYDEITFNYGGYPTYADALWFEVKDS
jgi:SET domain-containing protein